MNVPARIALIGLSGYGRVHLQLARESRDRGEAAIVAATVINPEEEAANIAELQAHGTRIYHDYTAMLRAEKGGIDLCLIPTGIHWHARMTIAALESGANVLVEKPLAGSVADVAAVRTAEKATGKFVAVGFQDLYAPGTLWLKQELLDGAIGTIQSVRFLGLWPRPKSYFERNDWAGRIQVEGVSVYDSPLNNAFAHFAMLSLYFASPRPNVASAAVLDEVELWRAHCIENFDTAVVTAHTPDAVRLWMGVSHACHELVEPEIVIVGTSGTAYWRYEEEACICDLRGKRRCHAIPDTNETRRSMMATVLARLRDPHAAICGLELAAQHTAMIEAIQRSPPIRDFPPESIRWLSDNGATVPEVAGLAAALRRAFEAQESLRAAGFSLASV